MKKLKLLGLVFFLAASLHASDSVPVEPSSIFKVEITPGKFIIIHETEVTSSYPRFVGHLENGLNAYGNSPSEVAQLATIIYGQPSIKGVAKDSK